MNVYSGQGYTCLHQAALSDQPEIISLLISHGADVNAQDEEEGGIADRPGDVADVFHTFFGICGLGLLGYTEDDADGYSGLKRVDPVYALPVEVLERLRLPVFQM